MKKNKVEFRSFYKKDMPKLSSDKAFIFTDNLQAMCAAHPEWYHLDWMSNDDLPLEKVKTGVSDVNGTNQAGIRSRKYGTFGSNSIYQNSFGIIVKKYQQDKSGEFVSHSGTFSDNDEDFKLFTEVNELVLNKIMESNYDTVILPTQMGGRRSGLPYRFAEWLRDKIKEKFDIEYKILYFSYYDYKGYKLVIYL